MPTFNLEDRYVVIKRKHLTERQLEALRELLIVERIDTTACFVVEPHWPEYAATVGAVKARMEGHP